ncbi:2-hydroxyacid dehydrogenase [Streptomyces luteolus]|uniref:2-hydroxyacid dehydrogenase n=1 Tax=Streptomyces luteolus TaxID=3043615 RepID=A0ABT6SPW7_9ACTN|nr:2-hydroxyacid dehydrogenase [Streptomyces sp. B-S-A12]MDI3417600.1 2-hydroxyacid dehydrogenase [Streptomyces sp. B-S-A12]
MSPSASPSAPVKVLVAGDHFVHTGLFTEALRAEVGETADLDFTSTELPWPVEPFGPVAEVHEASGTEDQLIAALQGVRVCVTQMAPLTRRVLEACPDLELFAVGRGGPVNTNLSAATEHGVAVTYAPGRNATATAEHTVALLLAALRRIPTTHGELTRGVWRGDYYQYDEVGMELAGNTVGLVGYGAIGHRVARILNGFGAHVLVHDPYLTPDAIAGTEAELVGLDELLARSRVLSLHARLTEDNRHMISAPQLAALPAGSVVVNCARGGLLDYNALCDALDSGHLFAAAFDVFPEEPVPADSRLLRTPGIVMTPHLAGASRQTAHQAARICAQEVARYLTGEPLAHCANPAVRKHG